MKKKITFAMAALLLLTGCGKAKTETTTATETTAVETTTEAETTEETTAEAETTEEVTTEAPEEETELYTGGIGDYTLVWEDNFDGDKLSEDDWNYETHEVGWVNNELQEYIPSDEYAFVKDGNLVIQPVKEDRDGKPYYISGRVNTSGKHDFMYGRFEASIKVPEGKGFLPAFWMMPTDEGYYGQWPKCGEIDIMEVLGNATDTLYGTVHFGEPHKEHQGTTSLTDGDFSKEYHEFAVEWDPGQMRWYLDGVQYFETSDWFTKVDGEEEKAYPAPFNQNFHMILNVAVGGNWPGDPDDSTIFDERAAMYVDYVRVYQRESYDEANVKKPVKVMKFREADETGNFVYNSDFSEAEDLTDEENWNFLLFNEGVGEARIENGEIIIESSNAGTEEYSVQLVQRDMPMKKGETYTFSFEAYADEDRKMKAAVTAPEVDWIRYFPDTSVDLTSDWQTYSFDFEMKEADDDKGRVEFNMGKQGSTATIHIRNVRLELKK